nr:monodehydroascorbate reductase [Tanacetum cinerariifolium]
TMADMNINALAGQVPAMAPPFWDTVLYDKTAGCYRCQLDEQWFVLTKDTLREALQITPGNNNQAFVAPPSSDTLINFVNKLGYPKLVRNMSNVVTNDMFQPWRALTTIINLFLTGKASGFERPRALVLQILWGVVTRAHIDYAKRILEEFTQSIQTFIEDKWNLTRHTSGKKKATLIVIPSIQFTKLVIHHLQRRYRFYPRPDSSLHLPNEELVLGYLKFSAKGTKREVFGIPIPSNLITADIQEASYYQEYLAKVDQHRRYLAGETRSDRDFLALKPVKPARKPKSTAPKAPPRPSVSTPITSAQPAPTSAPAKPHEKKRKQSTETSDKPPKAKKSKYRFIFKKHIAKGKYQPLPEVPGKGKAKVTEEQVAHDLLSLQKPKKKTLTDQYIFQRRTSTPTGSFGHDEPSYAELRQSKSKESKKVVPGADEGGQARPDLGNARADVQSIPSPMVHVGSDHEHMDLDVADVSPQPSTEQLDESDKPSNVDNDKANAETKVELMVTVTIQQDMSSIPPITSPIIDLTSRPESPKVH